MDDRFKHPFNMMVVGPSGCGKTEFIKKFICNSIWIIDPSPRQIIWHYGVYQPWFQDFKDKVRFIQGVPTSPEKLDKNQPKLLIIDDLMHESNSDIEKLFTKYSHHTNTSVVYMTQNLFQKGGRTMSVNSHYFVLFRNLRDATQIDILNRQMFPRKKNFLSSAINIATESDPYSYIVLDLKPGTHADIRVRSKIFQSPIEVYQ